MECQNVLGRPSFEPFFVPYYEDRLGYIKCSMGHTSAIVLQSQKFEVLLESGANALTAGFTLEAAASFYAALERLYEFAIKVILHHRQVNGDTYDKMFKEMARQSERQLGAFLALYALEFGTAYLPNADITTFRNSVIHKGFIPTPDEAQKFCSNVYAEIFNISQRLYQNFANAITEVVSQDIRVRQAKIPEGIRVASMCGGGFFGFANQNQKPTFTEAYNSYIETQTALSDAVPQLRALHQQLTRIPPDA
jgi:hypothetical protein